MTEVHRPVPPDWKGGGHYSINFVRPEHAWGLLKSLFPKGKADSMNWFLMSTSGVHGTYMDLSDLKTMREEAEEEGIPRAPHLTWMVIAPRLVRITYGNVPVETDEQAEWLRGLVSSSLKEIVASQDGNTFPITMYVVDGETGGGE